MFVTGESKLGQSSLFADAEYLPILEQNADFATLYGFTEQEIRDTYGK